MSYRGKLSSFFLAHVKLYGSRYDQKNALSSGLKKRDLTKTNTAVRYGRPHSKEDHVDSDLLTTSGDPLRPPHVVLLTAKTRSAVEESKAQFIQLERRRLYAIYRPFMETGTQFSVPSPEEYISVIRKLSLHGMGRDAKTVYLLLYELLKKPLHPSQAGGSWDITECVIKRLNSLAMAEVMSGMEGQGALSFAHSCIITRSKNESMTSNETDVLDDLTSHNMDLLRALHDQLSIGAHDTACTIEHSEEKQMITADLVGAVAAALIRCNTTSSKHEAVELLQLASIARLRGIDVFNERVAEICAEAAAVAGDAETVTRIIFILYRSRGGLSYSSDATEYDGSSGGMGRSRFSLWDRIMLRYAPAWMSEKRSVETNNEIFHSSTVCLLKSVIHASLNCPNSSVVSREGGSLHEALRLFHSLRVGCHWSWIAGMAVELLTRMEIETARCCSSSAADCPSVKLTTLRHIQHEVQKVLSVLREAIPSRPSQFEHSAYSSCVVLALKCYLAPIHSSSHTCARVPIVRVPMHASGAELGEFLTSTVRSALTLFDTMDSVHQRQCLPDVLTLSLTGVALCRCTIEKRFDFRSIFDRLENLFLHAGLRGRCLEDLMIFFSLQGSGVTCGVLWLYTILATLGNAELSAEVSSMGIIGVEVKGWMTPALKPHRELLWELLSRCECQQVIHISSSTLVQVVSELIGSCTSSMEAIGLLKLLYSQNWHGAEIDIRSRTLVDRLWSQVLCFDVSTSDPGDIIMKCSAHLHAHTNKDAAVIVVGTDDLKLACSQRRSIPKCLREISMSCFSERNSFLSECYLEENTLVLTQSAVLTLIELRQPTGGALAQQAEEVLHWLQHGSTPSALFRRVLLMSPYTRLDLTLKGTISGEKFSSPRQELRDGVEESCVIAHSLFRHPLCGKQPSHLAVYIWDSEESESSSATEHCAFLLRHGVKSLSSRRAQVKRANVDVKRILRASHFPETVTERQHLPKRLLFPHSLRVNKEVQPFKRQK